MKRVIVLLMILLAPSVYADTIMDQSLITPLLTDQVWMVDDPGGTPGDGRATVQSLADIIIGDLVAGDIPDISATYLTLAQIGTAYDTEAELDALFAAKLSAATIGAAYDTEAELDALFAAKEDTLTNEAGLYSALSDVSDFFQPTDDLTGTDGQLIDLSAITHTNDTNEGLILPTWANVTVVGLTSGALAWDETTDAIKVKSDAGWQSIGATAAPTDAQYLTLDTDATLSVERVLTAGDGIDFTDGGAGSTLTIDGETGTVTNPGILELATNAETATGTDTARAVTPDGVQYFLDNGDFTSTGTIDLSGATVTFGLEAGDIPDISGTYEALDAEILRADTADNVSADMEFQDNIPVSFGNDNDWEIDYNTASGILAVTHTAGAAADVTFDLNDDAADSTYTITNSDGTYEANLDVEGDATVGGVLTITGDGDSYIEMSNNSSFAGSGYQIFAEGGTWYLTEGSTTEERILTHTDSIAMDSAASVDFSVVPNFEVPNGADPTTDAFGEVAADNNAWDTGRGALEFYDGTASTFLVGALASDSPSDGQVPKWNTGGTITWENDADSGGAPEWQNVTDPTSDATIDHDINEETNFTYTGAFTTGSQFLIRQLTGNPTGGVLFEVRAADTDVEVARFGDGTNYTSISQGGVISFGGTGSLTLANDQVVMDNLDEDGTFTDWVEDWKWTFDAADEEIEIINTAEYGANEQQVLIQNQDADVGAQMYLLDLDYSADDGQANADFIIAQDSGGTVWVLGQDGDIATTDGDYTSTNGTVSAEQLTTTDDISVTDDVLLSDGSVVGITGNEVITFNAAGSINVTGATMDVDGAFTASTVTSDGAVSGTSVTDGTVTLVGDGTITGVSVGGLPDNIVDNGMMADNAIGADELADADLGDVVISIGAATVVNVALDEASDFGDVDVTSVDKLEGVDAGVYIDLGADGVTEIQSDTTVQIGASDENLQITDGGTNLITIGTGSGVTEINTTLQFATTGDIMGGINISSKSGAYTVGTDDAHESYGTLFVATGAADLTLPSAVAGMSICLMQGQGNTSALTIQPNTGDYLVVDGARETAATDYASSGAAEDKICAVAVSADDWIVTSTSGTWSE
jgi:hypothetical protein